MFASPHFRREGVGPGCGDSAGSPGTGPTQAAAAAAAVCCLTRRTSALHLGRTPPLLHHLLLQSASCPQEELSS